MKVYIFVEGHADKRGLEALWGNWRQQLRPRGMGIEIIALKNKDQLLKRIGARAAEILDANTQDLVVGLPDLHPIDRYLGTPYAHSNVHELSQLQHREVERVLRTIYAIGDSDLDTHMRRFYGTALRHDLEMLLLASHSALQDILDLPISPTLWRHPVEDQDLQHPPKRIIEELFRRRHAKHRAYRDTIHAPAVLRRTATVLRSVLFSNSGQLECPVFKDMLDWVGAKTGVAAY